MCDQQPTAADFWAGQGGTSYTERNRVPWRLRIDFWAEVLDLTGARSVYEVGTNSGFNLTAMKYADPLLQVYGCEINDLAATQAERAGFKIARGKATDCLALKSQEYDLVASCGMLIHVPPAELHATMSAIANASADYVLAVEYAAEKTEEVKYRGMDGLLWRRNYGALYQEHGLRLVKEWDAGPGFDNCQAWLLTKRVVA